MYPPFAMFLVVLLSMLAGCGSSSGGGGAQTVTAALSGDNSGGDAQAVAAGQSGDFLSYLLEPGEKGKFNYDDYEGIPEYLADSVRLLDGDRLYVLSQDTGLTLVEISNPDELQVLGRYPALTGRPRELYLQDGRLIAVEDLVRETHTNIVVLDVADPGNIRPLHSLDLTGGDCQSYRPEGPRLYLSCTKGTVFLNEKLFDYPPVAKVYSVDLRNARVIDELVLEVGRNGSSHTFFGEHRMYIGTSVRTDEDGYSDYSHRLHTVDISDPTGKLVDGGHVPLTDVSVVEQMDEYRGVVRIVGRDSESVVVTTFSPSTSGSLQPSGTAIFPLTGPETPETMRLDGPAAYLVVTDSAGARTLVTFDLSDPAQPTLASSLEFVDGSLDLDPTYWGAELKLEDDRLFVVDAPALSPSLRPLLVNLFDVSDPFAPKLLDQAEFGEMTQWEEMTQEALVDQGTLLRVPFYLHNGDMYGGIQLIGLDPSRERLEPGAAWVAVWPGELQLLDLDAEHLLGVSGNMVQSLLFDGYTLHHQNTVALAAKVVRALPLANGTVARFASFDAASLPCDGFFEHQAPQAYVDFAPATAAGDPDGALGELHLYDCAMDWEEGIRKQLQVFARGDQLEILYLTEDRRIGLRIVDASDPVSPQELSDTRWDGYYDKWASNHSVYGGPAATVVRTDHAIVVREGSALRVIDLSNPTAPVSTAVNLPAGLSYGGLLAEGDAVLTSHSEVQGGDESAGRFYLDRISLAPGEPPVVERRVNIPGELLYQDRESGDLLTRELVRVAAADYEGGECPGRAYTYPEGTPGQPWAAECVIERLNLVSVADGVATLRDSVTVDPAAGELRELAAGDGVVFALQSRDERRVRIADLMALTGFGSGQLAVERALLPFSPVSWRGFDSVPVDDVPALYAAGKRALVLVENSLERILALGTEADRLDQFSVNRLDEGFPSSVAFTEEGRALLALGRRGVKWVDTDLDSATTVSVVQALIDYVDDIVSTVE